MRQRNRNGHEHVEIRSAGWGTFGASGTDAPATTTPRQAWRELTRPAIQQTAYRAFQLSLFFESRRDALSKLGKDYPDTRRKDQTFLVSQFMETFAQGRVKEG